jgi:hypothetical protein
LETSSTKTWDTSVILNKLPQIKQSPNGRKFGQSGQIPDRVVRWLFHSMYLHGRA